MQEPHLLTTTSFATNEAFGKPLFWLLLAIIASGYWLTWISPPIALLLGLGYALTFEHPYRKASSTAMKWLLQASVVGLGFGMNFLSVLKAGQTGFGFTVASIVGTLGLGLFLGKILDFQQKVSQLIAVGTAICGGSAIAAVAPVLEAEDAEISVALGTVFVLNAVALFAFPPIGAALGLTEHQFGLWAAIAIHDTSSVVGAATKYGAEALSTATTVKLSRALWIIPISLAAALWMKRKHTSTTAEIRSSARVMIPYFIVFFLGASLINTFVPGASNLAFVLVPLAKTGLMVTLFLIGAGLSRTMLAKVGLKPFLQGVLLWISISGTALLSILYFL